MDAKFAVIFKAELKGVITQGGNAATKSYLETAERMRSLAINEYGCLDFVSVQEGRNEISISYWENQQAILAWKNNPEHQSAQHKGAQEWYQGYSVEVVELKRCYHSDN